MSGPGQTRKSSWAMLTSASPPEADSSRTSGHVRKVPQPESCPAAFSASKSVLPSKQMQFRHIGEFNRVTVAQQEVVLDDALDLGTHNVLLILRQRRNEARRQSAV